MAGCNGDFRTKNNLAQDAIELYVNGNGTIDNTGMQKLEGHFYLDKTEKAKQIANALADGVIDEKDDLSQLFWFDQADLFKNVSSNPSRLLTLRMETVSGILKGKTSGQKLQEALQPLATSSSKQIVEAINTNLPTLIGYLSSSDENVVKLTKQALGHAGPEKLFLELDRIIKDPSVDHKTRISAARFIWEFKQPRTVNWKEGGIDFAEIFYQDGVSNQKLKEVLSHSEDRIRNSTLNEVLRHDSKVIELNRSKDIAKLRKDPKPTVVMVSSPYCHHCQLYTPEFIAMSTELAGKVNFAYFSGDEKFENDKEIIKELNSNAKVKGSLYERVTPQFFLIKDGRVVDIIDGVLKDELAVWYQKSFLPGQQYIRTQKEEGPTAAFFFARKYRYRPIPLKDLPSITPLSQQLWTRDQVIKDFRAHQSEHPEKKVIAVIVKSEHCADNGYSACRVTSAALEKASTSLVKKFKIYMAWIQPFSYHLRDYGPVKPDSWYKKVMEEYHFRYDPGARIVFINPDTGESIETNAKELELTQDKFYELEGKTPVLENKLKGVLKKFKKD